MSQSGSAPRPPRPVSNPSTTRSPNREGLSSVSAATNPNLASATHQGGGPLGRSDGHQPYSLGETPVSEAGRLPHPQSEEHERGRPRSLGVDTILNPATSQQHGSRQLTASQGYPAHRPSYEFGAATYPLGPPPPTPPRPSAGLSSHPLPEGVSPTSPRPLPALNNPRSILSPRLPRTTSLSVGALRGAEPRPASFVTHALTGKRSFGSESPVSSESPPVRPTSTYSSPVPPPLPPARGLGPAPTPIAAPTPSIQGQAASRSVSYPARFHRGEPGLPQEPVPPLPQTRVKQETTQWPPHQPQHWPPHQEQHRMPWGPPVGYGPEQQGRIALIDATRGVPATRGRGRGGARGGSRGARGGAAAAPAEFFQFGGPGSTMMIPVDTQIASRAADQKRQRNAGASRRFRERRKLKIEEDQEKLAIFQQTIRDLRGLAEQLEGQRDYYRSEKHRLRAVLQRQPSLAELAAEGPPSPEPLYANMIPSPELPSTPLATQGNPGYSSASSNERPSRRQRTNSASTEAARSVSYGAPPQHGPPAQYQHQLLQMPQFPHGQPTLPAIHAQQFPGAAIVHPPRPTSASSTGERLPSLLRSLDSPISEASVATAPSLAMGGFGPERSAAQDRRASGPPPQTSTYRMPHETGWASEPPGRPQEGGQR
jgi:hypothetical protein